MKYSAEICSLDTIRDHVLFKRFYVYVCSIVIIGPLRLGRFTVLADHREGNKKRGHKGVFPGSFESPKYVPKYANDLKTCM